MGQKDRKYNFPIGNNKLNAIIQANSKGRANKLTTKNKTIPKSTCSMIQPR